MEKQNKLTPLFFILLLTSLSQCTLLSSPPLSIQFINQQSLPYEPKSKKLGLGGLSSLAFDKSSGQFFALSDSKKNHRLYQLKLLKKNKTYRFQVKKTIQLKELNKTQLSINLDPEGIDIGPKRSFYIASEGQQIFKKHEPPQIFQFSHQGILQKSWNTPSVFWKKRQQDKKGAQENKGFESLSLDKNKKTLWTATEYPLWQDLTNQHLRLSQFDTKTRKLLSQYKYKPLNPSMGLTEVQTLQDLTFLTLERSYDEKKQSNAISLFWTNCKKATNILNERDLKTNHKPCNKKQVWSSKKNKNLKIDNLEGIALMPLDNKTKLLVLISDNNFIPKKKTQILFFKVHQK